MKKRRFLRAAFLALCLAGTLGTAKTPQIRELSVKETGAELFLETFRNIFSGEPGEVRELRKKEVPQSDEGHQEYYFQLLQDDEKRCYREMLEGLRQKEAEFYLTVSEDEVVDKVYHALLKDHPELFWAHNREAVYKTTYQNKDYCLFSPGYSYTDEEMQEIQASMEAAWQEVSSMVSGEMNDYEKVKTVYTYLIDRTEYAASEHDQNIAGVFWKGQAVCAGYAGATQYLLERLGIPCIYVEGDAVGSDEGHAWNVVELDGQYYYVDTTNGDQPEFLEGDAVEMAEHKTTIYDYLCPFPEEYELYYTASREFAVPECTARDKNFYVLNQGCFDSYDPQQIYEYCCMRLNNGAAVVRFKFSTQESFAQACEDLIDRKGIDRVAMYYMELYGIGQVQYHYGILEHLKTLYFMF